MHSRAALPVIGDLSVFGLSDGGQSCWRSFLGHQKHVRSFLGGSQLRVSVGTAEEQMSGGRNDEMGLSDLRVSAGPQ